MRTRNLKALLMKAGVWTSKSQDRWFIERRMPPAVTYIAITGTSSTLTHWASSAARAANILYKIILKQSAEVRKIQPAVSGPVPALRAT